jgi:hypothetical protein
MGFFVISSCPGALNRKTGAAMLNTVCRNIPNKSIDNFFSLLKRHFYDSLMAFCLIAGG